MVISKIPPRNIQLTNLQLYYALNLKLWLIVYKNTKFLEQLTYAIFLKLLAYCQYGPGLYQ
jgi:NADPH-dependent 7-cyano-7-deazaguanine reductase QueF